MRAVPVSFKLLQFTLFLLLSGGWGFAEQLPAQDEATKRELESRKQLERMKTAPTAPMPQSAKTHTEAESASPDSRSTVSFDPVTGKETVRPATSPSGAVRTQGAAPQAPVQTKKENKDGT